MNELEKVIIDGAIKAQKTYVAMNGMYWLHHAPETFISSQIALYVSQKSGRYCYLDASIKKIKSDLDKDEKGRGVEINDEVRGHTDSQRPDISIWYKGRNELIACIELKKIFRKNHESVIDDAKKLVSMSKKEVKCKNLYLLYYSEVLKKSIKDNDYFNEIRNDVVDRLYKEDMIWSNIYSKHNTSRDEKDWAWGFTLLRYVAKV